MSNPLFNCLNAVNEKIPYTYKKKDCSGYMLTMWLSHDPALIGICNKINPYIFSLSNEMIYKYFRKRVPAKRRYLKWTRKDVSNTNEKEVLELMDEYNISKREARLSIRKN